MFNGPDYRPMPPLETPGHYGEIWLRLFWGHFSFLLGPGEHKVLFVPSKSQLLQSCGSPIIKSFGLQIPWVFSVALPGPQVGKYVVGLELLQNCEYFFAVIVLPFVGLLLSLWLH